MAIATSRILICKMVLHERRNLLTSYFHGLWIRIPTLEFSISFLCSLRVYWNFCTYLTVVVLLLVYNTASGTSIVAIVLYSVDAVKIQFSLSWSNPSSYLPERMCICLFVHQFTVTFHDSAIWNFQIHLFIADHLAHVSSRGHWLLFTSWHQLEHTNVGHIHFVFLRNFFFLSFIVIFTVFSIPPQYHLNIHNWICSFSLLIPLSMHVFLYRSSLLCVYTFRPNTKW